ncbi:GMC oxidoreductase [Desulfosporosinus sp. BG]|uniref:GMC oxidoreductase n=1 Tax=Desulfosporosinus sp. BG TaxID=1633135 RepID=UPI00083A0DF9|nr:GMC oxidoreductase [Desulfosporosinus sp. BG]ODA39567.1 Uncharacterized protein DSBG_3682 [Desulfosporosinus sp. BG]
MPLLGLAIKQGIAIKGMTVWTSAHPGGSVRIGEIVDSNLKSEYDNLYVCDCSVIPTEWGLQPTLTVLALAKRLAKHLLFAP